MINPSRISISLLILCFTALTAADVAIDCGSSANSAPINGREWLGDVLPEPSSVVQLKGQSTASKKSISTDEVPYTIARISQFRFSYAFQLNSGQKIIRLHFKPSSYEGFDRFTDLFTVEVGDFTLLSNFSASLTAESLGVKSFVKEFCLYINPREHLNIIFTPASTAPSQLLNTYAFVNGIELISVPLDASYYRGGETGVQLIGHKHPVYFDYGTALERIHKLAIKQTSVHDSFDDIFPVQSARRANAAKNSTWRIPVDVGFRYLIRLHLSESGHKVAASGYATFNVFINEITADTSIHKRDGNDIPWYMDYMVMMRGQKTEIKYDISISVKSNDEFADEYGIVAAIEILKLSNLDNSLASPNPLPIRAQETPRYSIRTLLVLLGRRNKISTIAMMIMSLLSIILHTLQVISEANYTKEENKPLLRAPRVCRHFSLAEIKLATENFNESFLIGKGGFGKVYRGVIHNGQTTVAVKRLKPDSSQGVHEFLTEIETLSELRHFNLVSLIGYCNAHGEMILVYDYMVGGTLADHLYKLPRENDSISNLTWKQRLSICIGAARGLDYLHTGQGLIHRDVKASNILLDEDFVAKVSDFGLAKQEDRCKLESHVSTKVKGTRGYLDPCYMITNKLTRNSDTYAFGVVLLEILCGRPPVDYRLAEDEQILTGWVRENIGKGNVDQIVSSSLRGEISERSLKAFVAVAERCLDYEPKKRPSMTQVVLQLESVLEQLDENHILEKNEIATDVTEDLKPSPIELTADLEVVTEQKEAKIRQPQHFWQWNVFRNRVKQPAEDGILPGTNLQRKIKLPQFFQRRQKVKESPHELSAAADPAHRSSSGAPLEERRRSVTSRQAVEWLSSERATSIAEDVATVVDYNPWGRLEDGGIGFELEFERAMAEFRRSRQLWGGAFSHQPLRRANDEESSVWQ